MMTQRDKYKPFMWEEIGQYKSSGNAASLIILGVFYYFIDEPIMV